MSQSIGAVLFATAVIGNLVVIVIGVMFTMVAAFYRGRIAAGERRMAALKHDAAFHHVDAVATPLFEQVFMVLVTALVLVGLPVALAAIFSYVLPLLGRMWAV